MFSKKVISGFVIGFAALIPISSLSYTGNEQVIAQEKSSVPTSIDNAKIVQWIKQQGEEKEYFLDGLTYKLVNLDEDNNLELVASATGGSGVHEENTHLWYLDNGKFVEAWEGNLKTLTSFQNINSATIATYHLDEDRLFYFSNSYKHPEEDTNTPPEVTQKTSIFRFDGAKFVQETR